MRQALAAALLAAGTVAPPAHGLAVWSNAGGSHFVDPDGSACFELFLVGPFYGAAAAVGAMRTTPDPSSEVHLSHVAPANEHLTRAQTFSTPHDAYRVCLPGAGRVIRSGWIVYTVSAHSDSSDGLIVLRCTFRGGQPPACV